MDRRGWRTSNARGTWNEKPRSLPFRWQGAEQEAGGTGRAGQRPTEWRQTTRTATNEHIHAGRQTSTAAGTGPGGVISCETLSREPTPSQGFDAVNRAVVPRSGHDVTTAGTVPGFVQPRSRAVGRSGRTCPGAGRRAPRVVPGQVWVPSATVNSTLHVSHPVPGTTVDPVVDAAGGSNAGQPASSHDACRRTTPPARPVRCRPSYGTVSSISPATADSGSARGAPAAQRVQHPSSTRRSRAPLRRSRRRAAASHAALSTIPAPLDSPARTTRAWSTHPVATIASSISPRAATSSTSDVANTDAPDAQPNPSRRRGRALGIGDDDVRPVGGARELREALDAGGRSREPVQDEQQRRLRAGSGSPRTSTRRPEAVTRCSGGGRRTRPSSAASPPDRRRHGACRCHHRRVGGRTRRQVRRSTPSRTPPSTPQPW